MFQHYKIRSAVTESLRNFWQEVTKSWLFVIIARQQQKPAPLKVKVNRDDHKHVEEAGRWYFRRDILDRLDSYFHYIRNRRRLDNDAYQLFSRVGVLITSPKMLTYVGRQGAFLSINDKISFGAIAFLDDGDDKGKVYPKFFYFIKYDHPPLNVEPSNEIVFEMTLFYAGKTSGDGKKQNAALAWPVSFYVAVSAHGDVRLLKQLKSKRQIIKPTTKIGKRRAKHDGSHRETVIHRRWEYPKDVMEVSQEGSEKDPIKWAGFGLRYCYEAYMQASLDLRIRVRKGNLTAVFCLDLLRTPYFFADRDATYTEKGQKKKIFHIVRTHPRTLKTGKIISVKSHFKGQRSFTWNGYEVNITMPGFHHSDLLEATFGLTSFEEDEPVPEGMASVKEAAEKIDAYVT